MEELERYIQVLISEDCMECQICLDKPEDNEEIYEVGDIVEFLISKGVVFGIDERKIQKILEEGVYDTYVTVAVGEKAIEGRDGYYSYTFDTNPNKKPRLREDGTVDYLNLNLFQTVSKGDLIARYFAKIDGEDGTNVLGQKIVVKKGKHLSPLRGKGFFTSEDCMEYYALYDGKVEVTNGCINVTQTSMLPGNVDLNSGNLDVKGDLDIMGNVITGMVVKASGNVTIGGLVEGASIIAGKNVLIKGGILGGGRAKVVAGGNIFAQFIENAIIESGDCVQANSVVNSIVTAYNDINIFGKTSSIIGGSLKANRMVRTRCIGSIGQITTRINVGMESSEIASLKYKEMKRKEVEGELHKIETAINMMKNMSEQKEMLMMLTRTKIDRNAMLTNLNKEIEDLRIRMKLAAKAEVIAETMAYQGTIVSIDGIVLKLDNDYEKISFIRKKDKILTRMYKEEND
jgi:uncharacterized protein (DUF342 family)